MPAPLTRLAARLGSPAPDADLLARFVRHRDEAAFAALVNRHGPAVFGVCRRVLGNSADAEDAFQAVFLVLVNRADTLTQRSTLGDWLYGVAVRTALKARTRFARLRKHERAAADQRHEVTFDPTPQESWIDRELSALPDKFRAPVVLCLLHDRPRAEVAAELGIPEGTLASRLDTARKRLADRLARHRVPLAFTGLLVPVPAAVADAAVSRASDGAGVAIHQLANEVTKSMLTNAKWPVLVAAGLLMAAVGGLLLAAGPGSAERHAKRNAPVPEKKEPKWKQEFDKIYTLKDDELVKIIPRAEHPASRREFVREYQFIDAREGDKDRNLELFESHFSYVFEVDAKGKRGRTQSESGHWEQRGNEPRKYVGVSFFGFPRLLAGYEGYEMKNDTPNFLYLDNPDFVVRKGAPREKLIPALDKELREKLNAPFKVELKDLEREVWVASGKLDTKPRAWRKAGQVDVYSDEANVNKEKFTPYHIPPSGISTEGGAKPFLTFLSGELQTWVLWTDDKPPEEPKFGWASHWKQVKWGHEMKADRDPERVLKNVAEQTGLTFQKEKRKVPVLVVSERK